MRSAKPTTPARRAPLVTAPARVAVAGLALLGAGVTTVLGYRYAGDTGSGRTDQELTDLVDDRVDLARSASHVLSEIGGPGPTIVALALLAVLAFALRGGRGLALVVLGPPAAMVTTSLVLKPLIDRTRGDELAFPSGHTTSVASMAVACGVLVLGLVWLPRLLRVLAVVGLAALVLGVAISLVERDVRFPTDTVGAVGVALAVVLAVALAVDALADLVAGQDDRRHDPHDGPTEALPQHPAGHAGAAPGISGRPSPHARVPGPGQR